jgi:hypothetical protein
MGWLCPSFPINAAHPDEDVRHFLSTEQSSLSMADGWRVEDKKGILEVDKSNFSLKGNMPWNTENWVARE